MTDEQQMRIAVIGDSLTAGVGSSSSSRTYCSELQKLLRQKYPGTIVDAYGIGGQTTSQMKNRFARQILRKNPPYDTVIIEGGLNDLNNGRQLSKIQNDIDAMIKMATTAGLKVIITTITPWKGLHTWNPEKQRNTDELNRWIATKAEQGISIVDLASLRDKEDPEKFAKEFRSDVVHPNNQGYQKIAREIALQAFSIRDERPVISVPTTEQKKKPIQVR